MKICKDCKHYSERQDIAQIAQGCAAPGIPDIARLIIGDRKYIEQAQIDAMHIRYNDKFCGVDGKWWEAMPNAGL